MALWPLWGIIGVCCLIELVLQGADHGMIGAARWRPLSYQSAGFWSGLLRDWQPNYAAQPVLMFLTYGFLHAGFGHLVGNMLGLFVLGQPVVARVGARGFGLIYLVSMVAGGLSFGLLSTSAAPMVGASGAIFGLAGAQVVWDWQSHRTSGLLRSLLRPLGAALGLAGLNLVIWASNGGLLAWETHLGGFTAGALMAGLLYRNPRLANTRS